MNDNRLVVVHCVASLARAAGGTSQAVSELCTALADFNIRAEIVTTTAAGSENIEPNREKVGTSAVPSYTCNPLRAAWAPEFKRLLRARCSGLKADLIHNHGLWLSVNHSSAVVSRQLDLPLVVTPHGMLEPWSLRHRAMKKRLAMLLYQRRDLQRARLFHVTSQREAASVRALGLRQPIAVIPHGLQLPRWIERTEPANDARTVLFIGRLHPVKGLMTLIAAWAMLKPIGWRAVLAGPEEDGHKSALLEAIRAANLENTFTILPPVKGDEKWALYRRADLFVLPSFTENFGVVVVEALACGVPVITTKGTPWECLLTQRCGWWVESNAKSLADALREAMGASDAERRDMGLRGRELVERDFDWKSIASAMKDVYRWILDGGTPPGSVIVD